jgi:hypothetical protein
LFADELDGGLEVLRQDLVQERLEDSKEIFYSFGGVPEDFPEPPAVIILPEFDSLMMGYRDRSRFLTSGRLGSVSRPQGLISRTILVDGFVSATWERKRVREGIAVNVAPFREMVARERRLIEEKFEGYGDYLGTGIRIEFREPSN